MANGNSKRTRAVLASLEAQGCTVKEVKRGWMIHFPNGDSMTIHGTEGDHRAEKNTRARVIAAGLHWPFDGRRR